MALIKCVLLMVSYCCDVFEGIGMSRRLHRGAVKQLRVRYTLTEYDTISGCTAGWRSMQNTKMITGTLLQIRKKKIATNEVDRELA